MHDRNGPDHLSSKQSSAPYDVVRITDYISVVKKIKGMLNRSLAKSCVNLSLTVPPADQSMGRCHAAIVIGQS